MKLDWHDLKTNGCPALLRALKQIEDIVTQQAREITDLQYLVSEEIMIDLAQPDAFKKPQLLPRQHQVVAELGHGWQIEYQPPTNPEETTTAGTPADLWLANPPYGASAGAAADGK